MTLNEYINYPMGKGNSAVMIGDAKSKMIEKFLLVENDIRLAWFKTSNTLIAYAEIPSSSSNGLYYDVIIEFPYSKADLNKGNNIFDFPFRVYSNCPSFIYTYAYTFYHKDLLCKWLLSRYSKETLTIPPEKRNSFGVIFYERSIFFTLYYIFKNMNVSVQLLMESAISSSQSSIREKISSQNDIKSMTKEIHDAEKKEKKALEKDKGFSSRKKRSGTDEENLPVASPRKPLRSSSTRKPVGAKKPTSASKPKKAK